MTLEKVLLIKGRKWKEGKFPEIGRGGEAVIYALKEDTVAKVFLEPSDPQFASDAGLQKAAEERIVLMQTKLYDIPNDLPSRVVVPNGILIDENEKIFGYTMPFIAQSKNFSEIKSIQTNKNKIKDLLLQLYDVIAALHNKGVIIGDLNENNILVTPRNGIKIVDVDSMQFDKYICTTFITRYTPPEFLKLGKSITLKKKRNDITDWYAFLVIAMRLLANTDPYGGVVQNMTLGERLKNNITIFDPRVIYPVTAIPIRTIHRPVLEIFFEAFFKKARFVPDRSVFESLPETEKQPRAKKKASNADVLHGIPRDFWTYDPDRF